MSRESEEKKTASFPFVVIYPLKKRKEQRNQKMERKKIQNPKAEL